MPRYYFDERDNEKFVIDDEGVEIDTFEHVKVEASSTAELIFDLVHFRT